MGLNENEIKLKVKQILELSKKNNQVRIYMNCKIKARD